MKISLVTDLKIDDAGVERFVLPILDKIVVQDNEVILDFCECGVDYPATSRIIDRVLTCLSALNGDKMLTILYDFKISELLFHKWFFVGSIYFGISEDEKELVTEKFGEIINEKLKSHNIQLKIEISKDGQIEKRFEYGHI